MEGIMLDLLSKGVSSIIEKFVGKLSESYFHGYVTIDEIRNLQTAVLPSIQTVIQVAESIPLHKLKPWLMDLKVAAFEAEDLLDLYEYKVMKQKAISGYKPLLKLKAKSKEIIADMLTKTRLKESLEKLKRSANEAEKLLLFISTIRLIAPRQDAKSQLRTTTVSDISPPLFGRDEEFGNLINMLINDTGSGSSCSSTSIPILAVIGIGGTGKTVMAQAVYNDSKVVSHFEKRIWVHVSRDLDVHRVTREIIKQSEQESPDIVNLDALQKMMEDLLRSMKILLILDDIWSEDKGEWDKLLIPLHRVGGKGSKILITTRTERVALILGVKSKNLVSLKELKDADCWSIVKYYAFEDASKMTEDPRLSHLTDVGMRISCKLKNSPLAARLVGSFLRRKVDPNEWEIVLKQDMLSDTLDCLLMSFKFLPAHLQRCFAFCSLFPKGYFFSADRIDDLVMIWVAEGFVEAHEDNELTLVDKGSQYFRELLSYSFFQQNGSGYVIHDLLHDLAEKISESYCFRMEADAPEDIPATIVHLSILNELPSVPFPDVSGAVNLRTIMCINSDTVCALPDSLLPACTKLRVLSAARMLKLPTCIGKLKHLRYLRAVGVEQLPDSFGKLYHLQFLKLPRNLIKRVPKSFSNLVNLKCMRPEDLAREKIPEIGRLTSLQVLESYYVGTSMEFGIRQLKNMHELRGSLSILGLENVRDRIETLRQS